VIVGGARHGRRASLAPTPSKLYDAFTLRQIRH
jgi:hypothetical protein